MMKQSPDIGAAGPLLREGREVYPGGRSIIRHTATRIPYREPGLEIQDVEYLPGTAILLRTAALRVTGLFDDQYFFSGEMADLCKRLWLAGFRCIVDTRHCIGHDIGQNTQTRERIHIYFSVRNRFLFMRKFGTFRDIPWMAYWTLDCLCNAMINMFRRKFHSSRAIILALSDGIRGRFGNHNDYFS